MRIFSAPPLLAARQRRKARRRARAIDLRCLDMCFIAHCLRGYEDVVCDFHAERFKRAEEHAEIMAELIADGEYLT